MLVGDMKVWEERWEALRSQINELEGSLRGRCEADRSLTLHQREAVGSLRKLLVCLRNFAEGQFDYFQGQFSGKAPGAEESTAYPQEHVMMVTLDQIGYDLWVIAHAIEQRFSRITGVVATLEKADELSYCALQPAADAFGLGRTRVISYLHKSPSIRVIPYANTALIGIPHTAVDVPRDLLAIPHEVGHFVFWHGIMPRGSGSAERKSLISTYLGKAKIETKPWAKRWLEELFADIYGCYVAGPVLALGSQDLQLQQSQKDFYTDDGDHPPPVLRPNIYAKGVCRAGFPNWANLLEKNWNDEQVGKRLLRSKRFPKSTDAPGNEDYKYAFKLKDGENWMEVKTAISLQSAQLDALLPVDCLIDHIFKEIIAYMTISADNWWRVGVTDCDTAATLEALPQLFADFEAKIEQFDLESKLTTPNEGIVMDCVPHKELLERWLTVRGTSGAGPGSFDPVWLPVFKAGGWATEGPEGNPTGP